MLIFRLNHALVAPRLFNFKNFKNYFKLHHISSNFAKVLPEASEVVLSINMRSQTGKAAKQVAFPK